MRKRAEDRRGVTLVELLVVISIVCILGVALAFSYEGWNGRYDMESQLKQIFSDLTYARTTAMSQDTAYFVNFPGSSSYILYKDTSPAPDGDGQLDVDNDAKMSGYPRDVKQWQTLQTYRVVPGGSPSVVAVPIANLIITFKKNGLISSDALMPAGADSGVIRLTDPGNPDLSSDYDCIAMTQTMINMGKWGDCDNDSSTPDECCIK